jgi:nucleoside-diphosphate-sugar epimerase
MIDVLVTGARGWIGGGVVDVLRRAGRSVDTVTFDEGMSVLSEKSVDARVVVHCGGLYSAERKQFIEQNIEQSVAIAKGASKTSNTVIFCSSVKVYGWAWSDDYVCDESDEGHALDDFGRGKRMIESLFSMTAMRSLSFRISNVHGPGSPIRYAVGKMMHDARTKGEIVLTCNGTSARDFVFIDDVVSVLVAAAEQALSSPPPESASHAVFNLASGTKVSLLEVARVVAKHIQSKITLMNGRVLNSPAIANQRVIDAGYIERFLHPLTSLESYLSLKEAT